MNVGIQYLASWLRGVGCAADLSRRGALTATSAAGNGRGSPAPSPRHSSRGRWYRPRPQPPHRRDRRGSALAC
ncbi:MAG: hypothetical protein ACHQ7N_14435 [Candidatus Methylomirabilales bacterium]